MMGIILPPVMEELITGGSRQFYLEVKHIYNIRV